MADADVSVIGTEIWNGDASQVSADGGGDDDERFSGLVQNGLRILIESGGIRERVFLLNLILSKSSDEDWDTVPDDLHDFGGWELSNIDFHVGISIVSLPSIESSDDSESIDSGEGQETSIIDGSQGIDLSSLDIGFMFVVDSVFIEPVINVNLEVKMVTEVSWSSRGSEKLWFLINLMGSRELFVNSGIVLAQDSKVEFGLIS